MLSSWGFTAGPTWAVWQLFLGSYLHPWSCPGPRPTGSDSWLALRPAWLLSWVILGLHLPLVTVYGPDPDPCVPLSTLALCCWGHCLCQPCYHTWLPVALLWGAPSPCCTPTQVFRTHLTLLKSDNLPHVSVVKFWDRSERSFTWVTGNPESHNLT